MCGESQAGGWVGEMGWGGEVHGSGARGRLLPWQPGKLCVCLRCGGGGSQEALCPPPPPPGASPAATKRYTLTLFFWPMRKARS